MASYIRQSFGILWSDSPSKIEPRIKRSPSLEEIQLRLDRGSVSPSKRTAEWLHAHSAEIKTPKALAVKRAAVTKPTPTNRLPTKAKAKFWDRVLPQFFRKEPIADSQEDIDGSTVIDRDRHSDVSDLDNDDTLIVPDLNLQPDVADASLIAPDQEDTFYTPTADELELMKTWSKDQVWTFNKLNKRGFEPLLPDTWNLDFVTVPKNVFTDDDDKVLISAHEGNEYNACKALQSLFALGGRVRDRTACRLNPEKTLRRELLAYYKWTIADAGLSRIDHDPVLAIGTPAPHESVSSVMGRVTDQLHELGRQYRSTFFDHADPTTGKPVFSRELPTIYGAVITYTVVTLVTYDARFPGKQVQSMGTYDFSNPEQDVWHAFAIAIVFVKARDYLISMKDEGRFQVELADDDVDPDA
ncbi:MAG: hypothetical protein Q9222_003351 [Ikaeria aurantiellina]